MKLMTVFFSDVAFKSVHRWIFPVFPPLLVWKIRSSLSLSMVALHLRFGFTFSNDSFCWEKSWFSNVNIDLKSNETNEQTKLTRKKNHSQRLHENGGKMKTIYLVMLSCTGDEMIVPGKRSKMNNLYSALKFHGIIWKASSVVELTETNGAKAGLARKLGCPEKTIFAYLMRTQYVTFSWANSHTEGERDTIAERSATNRVCVQCSSDVQELK